MPDPIGLVNLRAVVAMYDRQGVVDGLDVEALAGMLADWEADRERLACSLAFERLIRASYLPDEEADIVMEEAKVEARHG